MTNHIAIVVGTRPEVIKMAPVAKALSESGNFRVSLISTGQHRQMSGQAFQAFGLRPDVELDLMTQSQSLPHFASRALSALSDCLENLRPDVVLVQGDTTTTFIASLAAFYLHIQVGHVEAGMRTGNPLSPWPEEIHRRLTASLAKWHFVPVQRNLENLIREGIPAENCHVTGNTVIDALQDMLLQISQDADYPIQLCSRLKLPIDFFDRYLQLSGSQLILVTGHRRESHGVGIDQLCSALIQLAEQAPNAGILFPVHLNPQVYQVVHERLSKHPRILLTEPLDYRDFVWMMSKSYLIISDSGGIQGEAISMHKPLLVTRDTTEYPEGVECGACQLVGTNTSKIIDCALRLLNNPTEYARRSHTTNPYGDGRAADRIVAILSKVLI